MAAIPYVEKNRHSVDVKAIYKWMREKLSPSQDHRFIESQDKEEKISQNTTQGILQGSYRGRMLTERPSSISAISATTSLFPLMGS